MYESEFRSSVQELSGWEWQALDNSDTPLQFDTDRPVKRIILTHSQAAAEGELATLVPVAYSTDRHSTAQLQPCQKKKALDPEERLSLLQ